MKITSYFCDLCGSAIPTELVDDVKGLNIRVDLDHGAYESCLPARVSQLSQFGTDGARRMARYAQEASSNMRRTLPSLWLDAKERELRDRAGKS